MRVVIARQNDDLCIVGPIGEIDLANAQELNRALSQIQGDGRTNVVLDLWNVTFIDSVGLGVLVAAAQRAERSSSGFAVVAEPHGPVSRVLEAAGLHDAVSLYATRDMARATLGAVS